MSISIRKNGKPFDEFVPTIAIRKSLRAVRKAMRAVYNFDGVDDRGQLTFRAINIEGDNTFEFWTTTLDNFQTVVSQNMSSVTAQKEFQLVVNANGLLLIFGGVGTSLMTPAQGFKAYTKYGLALVGTTAQIFEGGLTGALVRTATFTKGTAREASAITKIAVASTANLDYFRGPQYDIKINGILYPMSEKDQPIQLPVPSNLGADLITPALVANPSFRGAQWTYLGDGRWQLTGDGTYNELIFVSGNVPTGYVLDFEIESISGGTLRCYSSAPLLPQMTNHKFNTAGKYRFVLSSPVKGFYQSFVRDSGTINCIIKNISMRPLYSVNPAQLVTNWDFSAGTTGWSVQNADTLTVNNGQATLTTLAGQNSRLERGVPLVAGKYYEVMMDVISITPTHSVRLNIIRGVAGNYAGIAGEANSTELGRRTLIFLAPASDALVQVVCGNATAGTVVVDNVSIREITSLCNPIQLANINPDRWGEVEGSVAKTRFVYDFDGVDDRGELATRAINPDGDNTFEFWTPPDFLAAYVIISQNIRGSFSSREFQLYTAAGVNGLFAVYGGANNQLLSVAQGLKPSTKYGLSLLGTEAKVYEGGLSGALVRTTPFVRGTAREASAITKVGCNVDNLENVNFSKGIQQDIKINGVLWKMDAAGSNTQPSIPAGNNMTLVNTNLDRWKEVLE